MGKASEKITKLPKSTVLDLDIWKKYKKSENTNNKHRPSLTKINQSN